jgi:glyoxylase-like metal-dependent hydrolase (beta-lactamase superfamily II)
VEIADGVLVRRYAELDLSVGLVLGAEHALVVDTRGDEAQGTELADAVRRVTRLPWQVVITHAHFDHCFGTGAFLPASVWAHERCGEVLARTAEWQRDEWVRHYVAADDPHTAEALAATDPPLPDHVVGDHVALDLGDRPVALRHLGRGHTDHDLVVAVPDARVAFAGDLVEQGAPPDFGDSYPADWPSTVDSLLELDLSVIVPGHGDPVDPPFVRAQRDELGTLAGLCRNVRDGSLSTTEALARSPYPDGPTLAAFARPA